MSLKDTKLEGEYELDLSEITHKGLQRMLRTALAKSKDRQLPLHKRGEVESKDVDDDTDEADKENTKLVEMHQGRGSPAPIPATDEDLPEPVADKLPKKSPKSKKA
jgi:hypothetical protein